MVNPSTPEGVMSQTETAPEAQVSPGIAALYDQQWTLRTGADYIESLGDGRQVWVAGEKIADLAAHPATAGMVQAHAQWYDLHHDAAWADRLIADPETQRSVALTPPTTRDELKAIADVTRDIAFLSAGNITHPPGYGALIMAGAFDPVASHGPRDRAEAAENYYKQLITSGTFMAAPYVAPLGDRFRPVDDRLKPTVVEERDDGIVVRGMVGLGTGLPYPEVLFTAPLPGPLTPEQALWFAWRVNDPGVRIVTRVPAARSVDTFQSPLSRRFDELEATVILDNVFIPWESVFVYRDPEFSNTYFDRTVSWLAYHHLARMLARAEYTFGLALAVTDALDTSAHPAVIEVLIDLLNYQETIRTSLIASVADSWQSPVGNWYPSTMRLASGTMFALENRARIADKARTLAGYGCMLAPTLGDLDDPEVGPWLEQSYGGGNWDARQRSALLQLLRDHTSSALDGREAAFEALASAGLHTWRLRSRLHFDRYSELANRVAADIPGVEPPAIDLDFLRDVVPLARK
jgi:4-hydroxyphenylacetate 3-monooxygenase/chlorophenol-4-monooxygenase component 2